MSEASGASGKELEGHPSTVIVHVELYALLHERLCARGGAGDSMPEEPEYISEWYSSRARKSEMASARNDLSDMWQIGTNAGQCQGERTLKEGEKRTAWFRTMTLVLRRGILGRNYQTGRFPAWRKNWADGHQNNSGVGCGSERSPQEFG
ncbi:hypothetical protein JB92DRAFT_2834189 [Gautieria morchelliformis]|nr:hypothetical protein JB92DRAFT_2834189 [Gautieria morchelliformis]